MNCMAEQTLKDKTARGLFWGFLNSGAMQLLNAVFGIVLARLLSQEDYGLIGMLTIFTAIASSLQESGFISALIGRKNANGTDFNSVFWFNISVSAAIYVLFFLCAPLLAAFYNEPILTSLFRYYSLGFFIASFSIVPRAILLKEMKQKELAVISVLSLVISGSVGITMAFMGFAYWGLATQSICYVASVSILSWCYAAWKPSFEISMQPVREMFGFSSRMLVTNIFNQLNQNIFSVVLGKIYTKHEVGIYNQANKWNCMGTSIISGMVQGVAQPMFVKMGDDPERLRRALSKMLRFTAFVSFPAMFGLALVAPEFIEILLGAKWLSSAQLLRIICIGGAFLPLSLLFSNFIISRGKSGIYMWNTIAQGLALLAAILLIHFMGGGIFAMVWAYVGITVLWLCIWSIFARREIGFPFVQLLKDLLPFMLLAAASMLFTAYVTSRIGSIYLLLPLRIVIAAAVYLSLLYLCGAKILRECLDYLFKKTR